MPSKKVSQEAYNLEGKVYSFCYLKRVELDVSTEPFSATAGWASAAAYP
jgi:hypothetical protein